MNNKLSLSQKISRSLASMLLLLCMIEVLLQAGVGSGLLPYYYPLDKAYFSYNIMPYFSKPCCIRDSISGFRWLNNEGRAAKLCRGTIVFDQRVKPNSAGFISPSDFQPHKKDSTTFRWLIFGDSFTDGYYLSQNWPSALSSILKAKRTNIEIHSFALNGSGIKTWARILDWLDSMNYEYDGVIIACFGNDLSREDFIMDHCGSYCYYGWADLDAKNKNEMLQRSSLILDSETYDSIKGILSGHNNRQIHFLLPYYTRILYTELKQDIELRSQSEKMFNSYILVNGKTDSSSILKKYGTKREALIDRMLKNCSLRNKKILLASIPEMKGLSSSKSGDNIQLNAELKWFSEKYKTAFFDGYSIGKYADATSLFLKYDGHWNQPGSKLYAQHISELVLRESK